MITLTNDDDVAFQEFLMPNVRVPVYDNVPNTASAVTAPAVVRSQSTPFECILLGLPISDIDGIDFQSRLQTIPYSRQPHVVKTISDLAKRCVENSLLVGAINDSANLPDQIALIGIVESQFEQRFRLLLLPSRSILCGVSKKSQSSFVRGFPGLVLYWKIRWVIQKYSPRAGSKKSILPIATASFQIDNTYIIALQASDCRMDRILAAIGLIHSVSVEANHVFICQAGSRAVVDAISELLLSGPIEYSDSLSSKMANCADKHFSQMTPLSKIRISALVKCASAVTKSLKRISEREIDQLQLATASKREFCEFAT